MLKRLLRIKDYANKKNTSLKLKYMFEYGNMNKIKEQSLFLHNELPIRLAKRAIQLERLPDNITNLYSLQRIHDMYINSFEKILEPSIKLAFLLGPKHFILYDSNIST